MTSPQNRLVARSAVLPEVIEHNSFVMRILRGFNFDTFPSIGVVTHKLVQSLPRVVLQPTRKNGSLGVVFARHTPPQTTCSICWSDAPGSISETASSKFIVFRFWFFHHNVSSATVPRRGVGSPHRRGCLKDFFRNQNPATRLRRPIRAV